MSKEFISFDEAVSILKKELQFPEGRALHFVKLFDKNADGKLSAEEFQHFKSKIQETKSQLIPKFKEYDKDGNGFITLDEASTILMQPPFYFPANGVVTLLKQFDKDGNGKLDIEEFTGFYADAKATNEAIANKFDQLDKDGNGVLSPDEVVTVIEETMGFDKNMAKHMVDMFDQNKDGSLDKREFMHMWSSMFGH